MRRLEDPEVLAAQSLLLYPSGAMQCAGIAFPDTGGLPYPFLNGFPVEDAAGVDRLPFAALTGAALAMRFDGRRRAARVRPAVPQRHGGRRPVPAAGRAAPRPLRRRAGLAW